ncbi:MAG: hypothetical protein RLZZ387_4546 [Chloroflexota bacterium]|jgi:hypothetical protein
MATTLRRALPAALALLAAGLVLHAYRELPGRPFAADDYQWLLNVRGLTWGEVTSRAFDAGAQTHFFRPIVWLLFWLQGRAFGLDPAPYHAVSLALHLLNTALLTLIAWRLWQVQREALGIERDSIGGDEQPGRASVPLVACCLFFVALHPAPFEAVVWVSAQSELLAALFLLLALHLWLPPGLAEERPGLLVGRVLLATLALGLALLAKESAVIGLGLLLLIGPPTRHGPLALRLGLFAVPIALTAAYLALQADILARNEIIRGAGYGLGPQLLLNPLRTLGLVAAPLPGTQYGDAPWLPWAGALLVGVWIGDVGLWAVRGGRNPACHLRMALAVALTLLPTAPFTSPPDSRYVYLPVLAFAALAGVRLGRPGAEGQRPRAENQGPRTTHAGRWTFAARLSSLALLLALAWWSAGELAVREWRFSAASGPGGSLWRLVSAECAAAPPSRVVVVDPPLAPPHAEAIVRLSCGPEMRAVVTGRDGLEDALRPGALVVAFPGGGAQVEQRH